MKILAPFQFSVLSNPWALVLLIGVAVVLLLELSARPMGSLSISTGELLAKVRRRGNVFWTRLPAVLRALGLAMLIVALARPLHGIQVRKDRADVIDIALCVDVSGSMLTEDFMAGGRTRTRIDVTKAAVQHFLASRKEKGNSRYGLDRISLIPYGAYAWTQVPLTLDYGVLEHELDGLRIDPDDERSKRTAIGSAIGLAVRRLSQSEAKSKVIILLTDGNNNAGPIDPITAARLAKDYDVRIYTIGAGSPEGGLVTQRTLFGTMKVPSRTEPVDEDTLKKIADATGGRYYRATDLDSLRSAYDEINALETTEVDAGDYYEYKEGFVPYAIVGAVALLVSVLMRRRWFEPIP